MPKNAVETVKTCTIEYVGHDEVYSAWYKCSLCPCEHILYSFSFCPDCGAKIEKEKPEAANAS